MVGVAFTGVICGVGGILLITISMLLIYASYMAGGGCLLTRGKHLRTVTQKSSLRGRLMGYHSGGSNLASHLTSLRQSAAHVNGGVHGCRDVLGAGVARRRGLGSLLDRGVGRLSRHRQAVGRLRSVVGTRARQMRGLLGDMGSTLLNFDDSRLAIHRGSKGICITVSSGLLFRSKDTHISGHNGRTLTGLTRILGGRSSVSICVRKRASDGPVGATRFGSG